MGRGAGAGEDVAAEVGGEGAVLGGAGEEAEGGVGEAELGGEGVGFEGVDEVAEDPDAGVRGRDRRVPARGVEREAGRRGSGGERGQFPYIFEGQFFEDLGVTYLRFANPFSPVAGIANVLSSP